MSEQLSINIDSTEVTQELDRLKKKLSNLKPLTSGIAQIMRTATHKQFENEGSYDDNTKWLPLSDATLYNSFKGKRKTKKGKETKRYERHRSSRKILTKSAQLRKSIQTKSTRTDALVGSNKIYAMIHQEGGMAGKDQQIYIPQRSFLHIGPQQQSDIEQTTKDYLRE